LRAARALLGIDQRKLAELSGLSVPTIQRMEASEAMIRGNVDSLMKLIGALIRNRKLRRELEAIASATSDQVACEWFEHPATIAYLTGIAAGAGPSTRMATPPPTP